MAYTYKVQPLCDIPISIKSHTAALYINGVAAYQQVLVSIVHIIIKALESNTAPSVCGLAH